MSTCDRDDVATKPYLLSGLLAKNNANFDLDNHDLPPGTWHIAIWEKKSSSH
jgi:hypothetical protein